MYVYLHTYTCTRTYLCKCIRIHTYVNIYSYLHRSLPHVGQHVYSNI